VAATVAVTLAVNSSPPDDVAVARGSDRPNIILIVTDDQTLAQLNAKAMPATERLLVARGTSFTHYYASTAQCCPSRAAMLTGQYGHNNGVLSNKDGYASLIRKGDTLPVWLRRAGYRTAHVGKWLNGYTDVAAPREVAPGWDQWHTMPDPGYYDYLISHNGRLEHRGTDAGDYATTLLNRHSVRIIEKLAPKPRPFYLQLDHRAPHGDLPTGGTGRCARFPAPDPAPRDSDLFKRASLPRPPSFNETDMSDKPSFLRGLDRLRRADVKRARLRWGCALASLREVDRGVQRILATLQDFGEVRSTAILFTSDNGFFYGEHRITASKVLPYEAAERLPLIMRVPRPYRDFQPRVSELGHVAANIDLAPTILDLANAERCDGCRVMDGRSLLDLLNGNAEKWPHDRGILLEFRVNDASRHATCHYTAIHTGGVEYIEHTRRVSPRTGECEDVDQRELYDLTFDPFQLRNLCAEGCPDGPGQDQLEQRLAVLRGCNGIAGRDPVPPSGYCE
jgi:N-acetylglucosamine-6-sulfatase